MVDTFDVLCDEGFFRRVTGNGMSCGRYSYGGIAG